MRLQLQDTVDGLENLDIGEAMTQLSSNQTQLQAAYMMLARLGSLSLLNFLK
jgi:flagellin-like hook-associated protein FlgL